MLTRSKCTAASEAAGEKNGEMEKVSDTVGAAPDPTLAQPELAAAESHSIVYTSCIRTTCRRICWNRRWDLHVWSGTVVDCLRHCQLQLLVRTEVI